VWNKDETDADLNIIGDTKSLDWVDITARMYMMNILFLIKINARPAIATMAHSYQLVLKYAT
jgi:hypothetical protein